MSPPHESSVMPYTSAARPQRKPLSVAVSPCMHAPINALASLSFGSTGTFDSVTCFQWGVLLSASRLCAATDVQRIVRLGPALPRYHATSTLPALPAMMCGSTLPGAPLGATTDGVDQ